MDAISIRRISTLKKRCSHLVMAIFLSTGFMAAAHAQSIGNQTLQLDGLPPNQIVKLPAGTTIIDEDEKCNKRKFKYVKKLPSRKQSGVKVKCRGSFAFNNVVYILTDNWLINEANPGTYQLVAVEGKQATPMGDISAAYPGFISVGSNGGFAEILSIATNNPYNSKRGWPYLRYRIDGASLTLVPMRMFTAKTNPINANRKVYLDALAAEQERQKAQDRKEALALALRDERLALARNFRSGFSGRGISISHNLVGNGRSGCYRLPKLIERLNRVVNEAEVYNNSSYLRSGGTCRYIPIEKPMTYQKVGWYDNGKFFISIVHIKTFDGHSFWKPVEVLRKSRTPRNNCFSRYTQRTERGVTIRIYGRDSDGLLRGCMSDYPFLGEEVG